MQEQAILFKILWVLTPFMVAAIGYFFNRSMARTDKDIDKLFSLIGEISERINNSEEKLNLLAGEHKAIHGNNNPGKR